MYQRLLRCLIWQIRIIRFLIFILLITRSKEYDKSYISTRKLTLRNFEVFTKSPIKKLQSPISNQKSPIPNLQSPIFNLQSSISNLQSSILNLQSSIFNLQSPIFNLQSSILNLQSSISNLQPLNPSSVFPRKHLVHKVNAIRFSSLDIRVILWVIKPFSPELLNFSTHQNTVRFVRCKFPSCYLLPREPRALEFSFYARS